MKRTAEKKRSQQAYNSSDVVRLERHRRGLESEVKRSWLVCCYPEADLLPEQSIGSQQNADGPPFAVTIVSSCSLTRLFDPS